MNGWMDEWMRSQGCDETHGVLGWAASQTWGSKWWSPWIEAQVTWLQGAPPSSTLFPLLLLGRSANFTKLFSFLPFPAPLDWSVKPWTLWSNSWERQCPLWCSMRWIPNSCGPRARPAGGQVWHSLAWQQEEGSRGLTISWNHWVPHLNHLHTHVLPVGLLANIFFNQHNFT